MKHSEEYRKAYKLILDIWKENMPCGNDDDHLFACCLVALEDKIREWKLIESRGSGFSAEGDCG